MTECQAGVDTCCVNAGEDGTRTSVDDPAEYFRSWIRLGAWPLEMAVLILGRQVRA